MRQTKNICILGIVLSLICIYPVWGNTDSKPKDKKNDKYTNFFKNKTVETSKSEFITLHKMESKIYVELPLKYLQREMLLGTLVNTSSDPSVVTPGTNSKNPLHVKFELRDSNIVLKKINSVIFSLGEDSRLQPSLRNTYDDFSVSGFKIEAYSPDSSAVVFDMTSFLAKPNAMLEFIPKQVGVFTINSSPKPELSFATQTKAYKTNASVKASYNYTYRVFLGGVMAVSPENTLTVEVTNSLILLPTKKMTPRIADARVGIEVTQKNTVKDVVKPIYLANRWNLTPSNPSTGSNNLSTPLNPIVFYIDSTFPEDWKKPIKEGVLQWNSAFEKIGFKDAIQVRDYPTHAQEFEVDNIQYSCIRYIPNSNEEPTTTTWVDPSTGEILNANIFVNNNILDQIFKLRYAQTANADPSIRSGNFPKQVMDESLSFFIMQEVGKSLGLRENAGASSSIPTDSLRSATFTRKYGISASVMDKFAFNFVAQPKDKGALLCMNQLGVYDYFAIDWNYRYFPAFSTDVLAQQKELERFVDDAVKNPMLRYAKSQNFGLIVDPGNISFDLGNDPIKSSNYGIKNAREMAKNLPDWMTIYDPDTRIKLKMDLFLAQQIYQHLKNVLYNVGGVYLNEQKESSGIKRYQAVSKNKQKQALLWYMQQVKNFQSYANRDFERKAGISVSYYDQLLEYIARDLYATKTRVIIANHLDNNVYPLSEYYNDIYNTVFKTVRTGEVPTDGERLMQKFFVSDAVTYIASNSRTSANARGLALLENNTKQQLALIGNPTNDNPVSFGDPNKSLLSEINVQQNDNSGPIYLKLLRRLRGEIKQRLSKTSSTDLLAHYGRLLQIIESNLNEENE